MCVKKFRKKPLIVEALRWDGMDHRGMYDFLEGHNDRYLAVTGDNFEIDHNKGGGGLVIRTLEGKLFASIGDWIIKGVQGEFYPCKPDVFEETYEEV